MASNVTTKEVVSIEDLVVSFDGFTVLDHLSFSVRSGELRFLIGPNGAGKTTLLDVLSGKTRPISGSVMYDGSVDVTRQQEHQLVQHGIGRKFQAPSVYASLTCAENLEVALGFRLATISLFRRPSAPDRDRIAATLEKVGLLAKSGHVAGALSHGEQQWLEIAMVLVQEPKLVLLDEPIAGMTRRERDKTGELLHSLEGTHTLIVTEHDMAFVRQFSRTVTVLHMGKVLREGPMEEVQRDPEVIQIYLGPQMAKAGV